MESTSPRSPAARRHTVANGEAPSPLLKSGHISSFLRRELEESRPSSPQLSRPTSPVPPSHALPDSQRTSMDIILLEFALKDALPWFITIDNWRTVAVVNCVFGKLGGEKGEKNVARLTPKWLPPFACLFVCSGARIAT